VRVRGLPAVLAVLLAAACSRPPAGIVLAVPGLPPPPPQDFSGVVLPPGIAVVDGRLYAEKDGAEMVLVPAGEFLMGQDEKGFVMSWSADEAPAHRVRLSPYLINRHPVTVGQFRRFCASTGRPAPPPGSDRMPVADATFATAEAYAAWAGLELATEARWERAARGIDGRAYPWDPVRRELEVRHPNRDMPVGSFPIEASPAGCLDMVGGPKEWCADWMGPYAAGEPPLDPTGPRTGEFRILRNDYYERSLTSPRGIYLPGVEIPLYEDHTEWRAPIPVSGRNADRPDGKAAFRCARGLSPRR